ncbi:YheT family hydrolase [Cystobacter fuscus]|uniref:YheT family hydrolase n=1 Tax=Cystobacter fuscus TaxID=43 RepID=UPI002B31174B|nr:alpha/beta fold hydrolase [Cystobacter fuscus]
MSFQPTEPFAPARFLASPHAQTIYASLVRPTHAPPLKRERWELPDGDFVNLDSFDGPPGAPHLVALHGLEGSSRSGYMNVTLTGAQQLGWGATALNFRSCGGETNRLARSYHSGDIEDALSVMRHLRQRHTGPLYAVGFSLGANVLLRLLEDTGDDAPVDAAAAVSAPYDLSICSKAIDGPGPFQKLYRDRFLRTLKQKAREKLRLFPGAFDGEALERARTLRAFDDAVTAPLHGFRDAAHYYEVSSSGPLLHAIRRPTLLLSAEDDPIIPASTIPRDVSGNPHLHRVVTAQGGHVGFVAGGALTPRFWGEAQVLAFLSARK